MKRLLPITEQVDVGPAGLPAQRRPKGRRQPKRADPTGWLKRANGTRARFDRKVQKLQGPAGLPCAIPHSVNPRDPLVTIEQCPWLLSVRSPMTAWKLRTEKWTACWAEHAR